MIRDYLPILLQVIVAVVFAVSALVISVILGKTGRRNATKDSAYECGMRPEGPATRASA
jgi:NADH-quinone oxidoreductase subunit A